MNMLISEKEILPGITLKCARTDKFKTGYISIVHMMPLSKMTASKEALIPKVLLRGTSRHPTLESVSSELDDMYGASVEPLVFGRGETHCIGMEMTFLDDFYAGEDMLNRACSFLGELMYEPATRSGLLLSEYVNSEREKLVDSIRATINNKKLYALQRLKEQMFDGEAYGIAAEGSEATAKKIFAQSLTKHYKVMISTSPVFVFYCGSAAFEDVEEALLTAFSVVPRGKTSPIPVTAVTTERKSGKVRIFNDSLDVTQGNLALGLRFGKYMLTPNYAAMTVLNDIYGGSVTSKLFTNVREKLSLCYYASSVIDSIKGVMFVVSGISFDDCDAANTEIQNQLLELKAGQISDHELESSKKHIINNLRQSTDSQRGLFLFFLQQLLLDMQCTPDDMEALVSSVTKSDVLSAVSELYLDSVYTISGREGENNEAL